MPRVQSACQLRQKFARGVCTESLSPLCTYKGCLKLSASSRHLRPNDYPESGLDTWIGRVEEADTHQLPQTWASLDSRNNRLADLALSLDGFDQAVETIREQVGAHRIGVILGTSTASIGRTESAYAALDNGRVTPLFQQFDADRDGINIGEAAGFALLLPAAAAGYEFHLAGSGETSDAWHMAQPHPEGLGARDAMRHALDTAGLSPADIGYVNLHGTATPANDVTEARALAGVFDSPVPASSTKAWTGHTLGAAGIVGAVTALDVLASGHVPGTLNLTTPEAGLAYPVLQHSTTTQRDPATRTAPKSCSQPTRGGGGQSGLRCGRSGSGSYPIRVQTAGMALFESMIMVASDQNPTLLVVTDVPVPGALADIHGPGTTAAFALVIESPRDSAAHTGAGALGSCSGNRCPMALGRSADKGYLLVG